MPFGAADLKLEIDYKNELHGWINCHLTFAGVRRHLYASNVFPPFPELLNFMRAIYTQRLPYKFLWDEEGRGAEFQALPISGSSERFCLRIVYDNGDGDIWVDAELDRQAVIDVLLAPLHTVFRHTTGEFQKDWRFTAADIDRFYHLLSKTILPRSPQFGVQHFSFEMEGFGKDRFPIPLPLEWITINIYDIPMVCFSLEDNQIFWPYWFSWLEKILRNGLPAQFQFHDQDLVLPGMESEEDAENETKAVSEKEEEPDEEDFFQYYNVIAAPVEDPALFHFSVTKTNPFVQNELLIDETFDRNWFVSAFCEEFERFIGEEYLYLGPMVSQFDLRTLPLERLKRLLS